jgi:hypothetical protein
MLKVTSSILQACFTVMSNTVLHITTWHVKGRIVEPEEEIIARQRLSKHAAAASDMHMTTKGPLWSIAFYAIHAEGYITKTKAESQLAVSWESVTTQQGCEHESREVSIVRIHYQEMTSEDTTNKTQCALLWFGQCVDLCESVTVTCSYKLSTLSKSNY